MCWAWHYGLSDTGENTVARVARLAEHPWSGSTVDMLDEIFTAPFRKAASKDGEPRTV